jgi:hypothetical protein
MTILSDIGIGTVSQNAECLTKTGRTRPKPLMMSGKIRANSFVCNKLHRSDERFQPRGMAALKACSTFGEAGDILSSGFAAVRGSW